MAQHKRQRYQAPSRPGRRPVNQNYLVPKTTPEIAQIKTLRKLAVPEVISVKDFADKAGLPVTQVISCLMKSGILATINQTIDFDTAVIVGDDLGLLIESDNTVEEKSLHQTRNEIEGKSASENMVSRSPIVTIMGHVDHGKTTLLDRIRETSVALRESGGITQHISAYQIVLARAKHKEVKGRSITFIDTPGHAAFSAMREHGATITDMVVLIVAANDGVMPQTIEVIKQAQERNVPIIVAINKTDLPDSDVMRTKQQLAEYDLVPEDWGGKTIMVEISAKTGDHVDDLLEMIVLQADMMDLKADPNSRAIGVVIESNMQKGAGVFATVLIENGTIRQGDAISVGSSWGKVRILEDFSGKRIESAGPSAPVHISGLKSMPNFGDKMIAFETEKEAHETATRQIRLSSVVHVATATRIDNKNNENGEVVKTIEYNLVIKSDVVGSLQAIKKLLQEINSEEISIKIVSDGVGPISESDVTLAKTTRAEVIGFRVPVMMAAKKIAENEGIKIKKYDIIYKLIDDIKSTASKLLPPEVIEEILGSVQVLAIFRDDKKAFVAGGRVEDGLVSVGDEVKVFQAESDKYHDKIQSLRKGKQEAKECNSGIECGVALSPGAKVAVGDKIVAFKTIYKERIIV